MISSQEAADLLNVSRPFVVKLAKTGQLAHHLVGIRTGSIVPTCWPTPNRCAATEHGHWRPLYPSAGTPPKTSSGAGRSASARPVAVLDANVLIPAGLRDLMLWCADVGVFRPVWQAEIENEVVRNSARLTANKARRRS